MGQHSHKSTRKNPLGAMLSPGRRRWTTVAAGAAVIAVASTTAWAAVANGDNPPTAAAGLAAPAQASPAQAAPAQASPATGRPATPASPAPSTAKKPTGQASATKSANSKPAKPKARVISSGQCGASFYGEPQMTASGERFDPSALTAAHKTLPLGSKVRVINATSGASVTVRINDRGPFVGGRCLDLSEAAFATIGNTDAGVMNVKYEVLAT